jgi:hypothetical protein
MHDRGVTGTDGAPVRVEIAPPLGTSWFAHLSKSLVTFGAYDLWRLWDPRMTYRTRLVAVNRWGQQFTLFAAIDTEEATAKRDRLERELQELPVDVWCDRYVVPPGFVDGTWRPGRPGHETFGRRLFYPDR